MALNIIITGGSGYIAQRLIPALRKAGHHVIAYSRQAGPECSVVTDYSDFALYEHADAVINCAGLAHTHADFEEFKAPNSDLPVQIAETLAGLTPAPRLIQLSSIGAREVKQRMAAGMTREEAAAAHPYQLSKLMGEEQLAKVKNAGAVTCIRPPMVYGPECPGNLRRLARAIRRGVPLPLGDATAPRHYIYIENLASAVLHTLANPQPGYSIVEVADAEAISTRQLCERLGQEFGTPARMARISPTWLGAGMRLLGKGAMFESLFSGLLVENTLKGWAPPYSLQDGMKAFCAAFNAEPTADRNTGTEARPARQPQSTAASRKAG